jgi:hypothetical protein
VFAVFAFGDGFLAEAAATFFADESAFRLIEAWNGICGFGGTGFGAGG